MVQRILDQVQRPIEQVMGHSAVLKALDVKALVSPDAGAITVSDIVRELEKPGRDPRPDFVVARFNEGVQHIADLQPGMVLEGTVSNVAAFGAFVDIGVHQVGLVHVSQLAHKFVEDAREVVKTGQIVKVKVLEVDAARKRISLTLKMDAEVGRRDSAPKGAPTRPNANHAQRGQNAQATGSAMASAFAKLKGL